MDNLLEYLARESKHQHTEFRLVVMDGGQSYIHVPGRDSETMNFQLPQIIHNIPDDIKAKIGKDIDEFERNKSTTS